MGLTSLLGLLITISWVVLLLPPNLISLEGLAVSYTRSLPIRKKTMILSKMLLTSIMYITSLAVLLVTALYFRRDAASVLIFGITNLFSVIAAATLELILLTNKLWKESSAIGNMYAKLLSYIVMVVLGLVVVSVPIIGAFTALFFAPNLLIPIFLGLALVEFALTMAYFSRQK
jgi:predicted permease